MLGQRTNNVKRAVYTIRDHEGWAVYVGSSGLPEGRFAGHMNSDTPVGAFMRVEKAAGREVYLRIEEWFETKDEGNNAERLYIAGYERISGQRLLNRSRPGKHVCVPTIDDRCITDKCRKKRYMQGLCSTCFYELCALSLKLPKKHRDEYFRRCVEAGLILPEEEEPEKVTGETIFKQFKQELSENKKSRSQSK